MILSFPTCDPELHFGPKLGLGRQGLSGTGLKPGTGRKETAASVHTCHHLSDKRAGSPDIQVLKSGPALEERQIPAFLHSSGRRTRRVIGYGLPKQNGGQCLPKSANWVSTAHS